jgi:hypothetical protein
VTVLSILGLAVGLAALLLSALIWVDKKRAQRDQDATDELMMNYLLLVARGQGSSIGAGMMKTYVPGFDEQPPVTVDVVHLVERLCDMERQGRPVTLEDVRALGPCGLGVYEDPAAAVDEAISSGLVQRRRHALKLTRKARIFHKALRYFGGPLA